jgi:hypothetical protein
MLMCQGVTTAAGSRSHGLVQQGMPVLHMQMMTLQFPTLTRSG